MKKPLLRVAAPFLLLAFTARPSAAQVQPELNPAGTRSNDTVRVQLTQPLDSLVAEPQSAQDSARLVWLQTPPGLQDLVGDRVACLDTDMPHVFNGTVMSFVNYFTLRNRGYTQRILERQNLYFPLFEKYLAKYHLPQDLKYLAVVESALLPTARSRVGAVGLWQFMGPTGRDMRLVQNEYIDERMNPEKSTEAACKYLRDLYRLFGDWELVLAAYNWGGGNVQRAMKRTGKKTFWDLYPQLPKETRNYVPTFTAAMYTLQYAKEHGLHNDSLRYLYPEATDTLVISGRSLDLRKFSAQFGLDSAALGRYNPEIRKTYLPESIQNYKLTVPACVRTELALLDRATVLDFCKVVVPPPRPITPLVPALPPADSAAAALAAAAKAAEKPQYRRIRHSVKRGETVADVAERYDVSPAQVRRWNQLRKGKALVPKQQLVVFVPIEASETPAPAVAAVVRKAAVPAKLPLPGEKPEKEAVAKAVAQEVAAITTKPTKAAPVAADKDSTEEATPEKAVAAAPVRPARSSREREAAAEAKSAAGATADDDSLPAEYTVRRGDNLTKLARERGLTVAQLMSWNSLATEAVVPGQKLLFRAPTEAEATVAAKTVARRTPAKPTTAPAAEVLPAPKVHLVQPGDTLYNISRRYQGVTVEQLRRLNHLKSDEVKPGQKLLVQG
ncbi:LysM peptidoglycan-binding domain-containing protein [Hymenobacter chitinivorans]|uniref:Membrane-bound lytic murein transglycosylase D n=1 Tax=Hymenobacter chitinivorans DSM 11115 TaxID=1121954 RepID=A0A2M9B985_9BACT|nr:LysM peptidoglycan-binding domain-containing protein [Hymenobacter chitinivorans]PJJ54509.1 membrane-bound lytic murein transglycosylase D [Hymenobacter chitinivorans DSM 11115]